MGQSFIIRLIYLIKPTVTFETDNRLFEKTTANSHLSVENGIFIILFPFTNVSSHSKNTAMRFHGTIRIMRR